MQIIDITDIDVAGTINLADQLIVDYGDFELTLKFKSDYSQSKIVRSLIMHIFERNGLDSLWKNRFCLISDELVNNSIEYGSAKGDMNSFYIKVQKIDSSTEIFFEVEDSGNGNFPKNKEQMELIRIQKTDKGFQNYLGKRGRGLFQLVTNMVDNLYFKDSPGGGLIVGVQKKL